MGPEVILTLIGPVVGGAIGISTFLYRRTVMNADARLKGISDNVEVISYQLTGLQLKIAESYVTKDELLRHIEMEAKWQDDVMKQLHEMREDIRRAN